MLGLVGHLLALVRPSSEPVSLLVHKPEVRRPQEKVQEPQELKYIEEDHILQEHFFDAVVVLPQVGTERMHYSLQYVVFELNTCYKCTSQQL